MSTAAMETAATAAPVRGTLLGVAAAGLAGSLTAAVLAFGGTEPLVLAAVEGLLLVLALALLWRNGRRGGQRLPWPGVALVALTLLQIVPLPERLLGRRTLSLDAWSTSGHLILLVSCVAAFFVGRETFRDAAVRRRVVLALVTLALCEAFYGIGQGLTGSESVYGRLKPYGAEDPSGTYVNRNHFAGFLAMTLPLALAEGLMPLPGTRSLGSARAHTLFWLAVSAVLLLGVVLSKSRMGLIACLISIACVAAVHKALPRRARVAPLVLGLVAAAGVLAVWLGFGPVTAHFGRMEQDFSGPGGGRLGIWQDTVRLIAARPWLGCGLGAFPDAYTQVQTTFLNRTVDHAHNDYLQVAAELGVPGAVLLFGTVIGSGLGTVRRLRRCEPSHRSAGEVAAALGAVGGLAAFLVHSAADFNLYIPANALILSSLLALGCSTFREPQGRN